MLVRLAGKLGAPKLALGAFLVGASLSIPAVWACNEFWLGKQARNANKTLQASIEIIDKELRIAESNIAQERGLKNAAILEANRLSGIIEQREEQLTNAFNQTSLVLSRIPKDTHTIRIQGEEIGDRLANQEDTAWVRNIWPVELWNHAWGDTSSRDESTSNRVPLARSNQSP